MLGKKKPDTYKTFHLLSNNLKKHDYNNLTFEVHANNS